MRRLNPWEIPPCERATVGSVLQGLAAWFDDRAADAERSEIPVLSLSLGAAADDIREYAAEILSWSHVHANANGNT